LQLQLTEGTLVGTAINWLALDSRRWYVDCLWTAGRAGGRKLFCQMQASCKQCWWQLWYYRV